MNPNICPIIVIVILLIIILRIYYEKKIIEEFTLGDTFEYKIPIVNSSILPHYPTQEDLDIISSTHRNKDYSEITNKFNDLDTRISLLQIINNEIDNNHDPYIDSVLETQIYPLNRNKDKAEPNTLFATDRSKSKESNYLKEKIPSIENIKCINFKNINQCMATCSKTKGCYNFYIEQPNKCCIIMNPVYEHITEDGIPKSENRFTHIVANNRILNNEHTKGKIIFNYYGTENNNGIICDKYVGNLNRSQCKSLCPKCVIGRCPKDYRCIDMTADPRYINNCMITNNNNYNENIGKYFDNQNIPYMDEIYGLVGHPAYDTTSYAPLKKK